MEVAGEEWEVEVPLLRVGSLLRHCWESLPSNVLACSKSSIGRGISPTGIAPAGFENSKPLISRFNWDDFGPIEVNLISKSVSCSVPPIGSLKISRLFLLKYSWVAEAASETLIRDCVSESVARTGFEAL